MPWTESSRVVPIDTGPSGVPDTGFYILHTTIWFYVLVIELDKLE